MTTRALLEGWLSAPANPPVRYLVARDLVSPRPEPRQLERLRVAALEWAPVKRILALQDSDGSFRSLEKKPTGMPTFRALCYLHRCGLSLQDEPVARGVEFLAHQHSSHGAVSHGKGGAGVLPCYVGLLLRPLIGMGGLSHPLVQSSLAWILEYQRYDHRNTRAGGPGQWPFRSVLNYGCWKSVSCFHGAAGTMRALSAVPFRRRSRELRERLSNALEYFCIHRGYLKSSSDTPLFQHMTRFFLTGGYRFHLIDLLEGLADTDPKLGRQEWVRNAVALVDNLAVDGCIILAKNYSNELIDPLPLEPPGQPSRFLTYQWIKVKRRFRGSLSRALC